jgi:CheY-like chemotaxis protein
MTSINATFDSAAVPISTAWPVLVGQQVTLQGRVLLAEDGLDNQQIISLYLRRAGAEVAIAANGRLAIERVAQQPLDLILMDMQMPELDGYAATRELRRRGCQLPIIALTADSTAGDREKCLAAGCTAYLSKPVERNTLIDCVAGYLAGRRPGNTPILSEPTAHAPLAPAEGLRSTYADDPAMGEAIAEFTSMLPHRVALMQMLFDGGKLPEVQQVVHQLKGAGGGYGFDDMTRLASQAEGTLKQDLPLESSRREVEALIALIRSVEGYQISRELNHA